MAICNKKYVVKTASQPAICGVKTTNVWLNWEPGSVVVIPNSEPTAMAI